MINNVIMESIISQLPPELIQELRAVNRTAKDFIDKNLIRLPGLKMAFLFVFIYPGPGSPNVTKIGVVARCENAVSTERLILEFDLNDYLYHLRPEHLQIEGVDVLNYLNSEWYNQAENVRFKGITSRSYEPLINRIHVSSLVVMCYDQEMDLDLLIEQMPAITNFRVILVEDAIGSFENSPRTLNMVKEKSLLSTGIRELSLSGRYSHEDFINFLETVKLNPWQTFECPVKMEFYYVDSFEQQLVRALNKMVRDRNWAIMDFHYGEFPNFVYVVKTENTHFSVKVERLKMEHDAGLNFNGQH